MKVVWLCNVIADDVADYLNITRNSFGGWINSTLHSFKQEKNSEIYYIFPYNKCIYGKINNINFYGFSKKLKSKQLQRNFINILQQFKPDVVHIWGTEFSHSLIMGKACQQLNILDKTILNVQGICSKIAEHYYSGLPNREIYALSFRDVIKGFDNVYKQKRKFIKRAKNETELVKIIQNAVVATEWMEACLLKINKNIKFYKCSSILNNVYYEKQWSYENCEKHSLFISQSGYPLKGAHFVLQAVAELKNKYKDIKLYICGKNLLNLNWKTKLKLTAYNRYLIKLIKKYDIGNHVEFIDNANENIMQETYLKSNCFVCASAIESESNSLGEAMILGVPCVTSFVGGITSFFKHRVDGYAYPFQESYTLAYLIDKIFSDSKQTLEFSKNARKTASERFNKQENYKILLNVYEDINNKLKNWNNTVSIFLCILLFFLNFIN